MAVQVCKRLLDDAIGCALGGGARLKTYEVRVIDDVIFVEVPPDEEPAWMRG